MTPRFGFEVHNRGPEAADLWVLPHLWFRNTWGWQWPAKPEPTIEAEPGAGFTAICADDTEPGAAEEPAGPVEAGALSLRPAGRRDAVHRQRNERCARVRPRRDKPFGVREGRLPPVRRQWRARCGESCEKGHEGVPGLQVSRARGRLEVLPLRFTNEQMDGPAEGRRRDCRSAEERSRRVLRDGSSAEGDRRREDDPAAGVCRDCCGRR